MALTLLGLTVLVFLMLRLIPGTVVEQMIGADAIVSPEMVAQLRRFFGLDQPWWVQYSRWLGNLAQGRSEEHTSELQSLAYLVCRLLLEKKKKIQRPPCTSHNSKCRPDHRRR